MFTLLSCSFSLYATTEKVLTIYHDSDYSNHNQSAQAMKMGVMTALNEVNNTVQGYKVEFKEMDNRGNTNRSFLNIKNFINDAHALVLFGGLHSPPYIKYREFINNNKVLLLIPWAAGAPITRYPSKNNWVFRLSVDDTKAGYKMVAFAQQFLQCKQPQLLLEDTPWGRSNYENIHNALDNKNPKVTWFSWNTKFNTAKVLLREMIDSNTKCILFVGNAIEGTEFVNAMASFPSDKQIPIVSHWGITGGDFANNVKSALRNGLNLHFIQSCFSFISSPPTVLTNSVIEGAKTLFPFAFNDLTKLEAPTGFIHAYDLTKLLLSALNSITITENMNTNRTQLKYALEHLEEPVEGLLKTYQTPFSTWSTVNPDAHEALGLGDLCMAKYNQHGGISVLKSKDISE
jgi:branched-chain amino acid transport system substrate-binding protein